MNCLVSGGAGFIGSNLALELEKCSYTVTILDSFHTGTQDNLKRFKGKLIEGNVQTFDSNEKFDVIFHQAAITDPHQPDDNLVIRENLIGFSRMLDFAKKCKAKLVYASTANLYGNGPVPMRENQKKDTQCAYGVSKLIMDEQASMYGDSMHIVGLRYFNVFGSGEAHKGGAASMVYHLARQMKKGERPRIFRSGEQKRDHIYVKDVVRANLLALDAPSGIYNVGTGIGTSFNKLVEYLNTTLHTLLKPEYIDMPYDAKTYQMNTQADITLAKSLLKFEAQWNLIDGIKEYLKVIP